MEDPVLDLQSPDDPAADHLNSTIDPTSASRRNMV
jgi:hypothetical protein